MVREALAACRAACAAGRDSAAVMDARAVKPLDAGALAALAGLSLVVCEEGIESGGLGQSVRCAMQGKSGIRILSAGDAFYPALAPMRA